MFGIVAVAAGVAFAVLSRRPVEEIRVVAAEQGPPREERLEKPFEMIAEQSRLEPPGEARPEKSLKEVYERGEHRTGRMRLGTEPDYAFLAQYRRKLPTGFAPPQAPPGRRVDEEPPGSKPGDPGPPGEWGPQRLVWAFVFRNVPFQAGGFAGEIPADVIVLVDAKTGVQASTSAGYFFERPTPPPVTPGPRYTPSPDSHPSPSPRPNRLQNGP